jgi:hypothetical protein
MVAMLGQYAIAAAALLSSAAAEQDTATPCELHIWGGERFRWQTTGVLSELGMIGSLIDRASRADDDRAGRPRLAEALDTQGQTAALSGQPLTLLLSIGNRRIVAHDLPLDPTEAARRAERHAESASPCYSELVVTSLAFRQSATLGRRLHASFLYRDFSAAAAPQFSFAGTETAELRIFPPAHDGETDAAQRELIRAFRSAFRDFASDMVAARTRRLSREGRRSRGAQ